MFEDIIGQNKIKKYLSTEILNDSLSYGYIIEGNKFMGKEFIANEIAKEITSQSYITYIIPSGDRKLIHVDDIRELKNSAYSHSFGKSKKVYIIPDADNMNVQSQNAFLKVLEEPPQDCVFILLSENRFKLLSTIRSRCTTLKLSRYSDNEIELYLKKCSIEVDQEILKLCDGSINKYLFLSSAEFSEVKALGEKIVLNIKSLHKARIFSIYKHIKKIDKYVNDILDLFLVWYRDMYVYKITSDSNLIDMKKNIEIIKEKSKDYTDTELSNILNEIEFARLKLRYNGNLEMTINTLLMHMRGSIKNG